MTIFMTMKKIKAKKNTGNLYMIKALKFRFLKTFLFLVGISLYEFLTIKGEFKWALVPVSFIFWLYVREIFYPRAYQITSMGGKK